MDISHNLEVAKPTFIHFIKNISKDFAQWVQYRGVEKEGSHLYFVFKSSQNSLTFKIYAGVNNPVNTIGQLKGKTNLIAEFFREVKNKSL